MSAGGEGPGAALTRRVMQGLMRVDTLAGEPLATVWNFAIHGTCLGSSNLNISGDIMGAATNAVEAEVGAVALFINADGALCAREG